MWYMKGVRVMKNTLVHVAHLFSENSKHTNMGLGHNDSEILEIFGSVVKQFRVVADIEQY